MKIVIRDGVARFLYDDGLHAALGALGPVTIVRASSVEFDHEQGGWVADLSPMCFGVVLGPFPKREDALAAEASWIERALVEGVT